MGVSKCGTPRSANVKVRFSLSEFTARLFELFGYEAQYNGPGPVELRGGCGGLPAPATFPVSYLAEQLYSKLDLGGTEKEKTLACLEKFRQAERLCQDTNWRFRNRSFLYSGTTKPGYTPAKAMWLAREKLHDLLRDFDLSMALERAGHGPGATTRLKRADAHLSRKLGGSPHSTKEAASIIPQIFAGSPGWAASFADRPSHQVVNGNKLLTVPKNYKSHRMIAIEPEWNMFVQKGVGNFIRSRLRRVGIELTDQSNNQMLAGLGSLYGNLATIDLSMASDCMAYELVKFLLPPEVFDVLADVRAKVGFFTSGSRDSGVYYQKFSSMGNGATFDLETAIFWSLASAVIDLTRSEDRRVLVYGDDIIVPTHCYDEVIDVLTIAGFVPNPEKSFGAGPFRESCGSHYFRGTDVTPIYVREAVNRLDRLFLLHNNTCRLLLRYWDEVVYPESVQEFLEWIRSHAPKDWRKPRLPTLNQGDGAFAGSFSECTPRKAKKGYCGWIVKTLQFGEVKKHPQKRKRNEEGFFTTPLPDRFDGFDPTEAYWCSLYDLEQSSPDFWFTARQIRSASLVGRLYRFREVPHGTSDVPDRPIPRAYQRTEDWKTTDQLVSRSDPFFAPWHLLSA